MPVWRAQLASVPRLPAPTGMAELDDRGALEYMRAVLSRTPPPG